MPEPAGEDPLWAFRDQRRPGVAGPDDPVPGARDDAAAARRASSWPCWPPSRPWRLARALAGRRSPPLRRPALDQRGALGHAPRPSPLDGVAEPARRRRAHPRRAPTDPRPDAQPDTYCEASTPPAAAAAPSARQLRAAVQDYYALLPEDLDAGWEGLTPRYQRTTARNRDAYASFWGSVDRVSVSDVTASAPGSVTATVTYDYDDGRVFVERTSYRLVRDDGALKIDRSSVLSSLQR